MWVEVNHAARSQAPVYRFGDLGRCPNQDIRIPDGRQPEIRIRTYFDPDVANMVFDGRKSWFLGQAEKRPLHRIALIANRNVREIGREEIRLYVPARWSAYGHIGAIGRGRSKQHYFEFGFSSTTY